MTDAKAAGSRMTVAAVLVFLAGVLVYVNTLWNQFPFDDAVQVSDNLYIRSLQHVGKILAMPTWPGYVYRPLPTLTYSLTWMLVGPEPWLYHLTSALLHAGVSVLVLLLLARVFGSATALLGALLFAVHPIHVEAVASVANRTELLAALLGIGAVLLLVPRTRASQRRHGMLLRSVLGATCFFGALLAKESALTLVVGVPLLVAAREEGFRGGLDRVRAVARGSLWPLVTLGLAAAAFFVARWWVLRDVVIADVVMPPIDNPLVALAPHERIARAVALLGRYLVLCIFPWQLSADYSLGATGLADDLASPAPLLWLASCGALAAATVVGAARGSLRLVFIGAWFFAAFAITANVLLPIGTIFADRLAYVPSIAVCALLAWVLCQWRAVAARTVAASVLVVTFALLTVAYNGVWYDDETLFGYEMRTSPSAKTEANYARLLLRRGDHAQARQHFLAALQTYPEHMTAAYGMAFIELHEGRSDRAHAWLEKAIESDPKYVPALVLLGKLRFGAGEVDEAARFFVRALNADNHSFDAKLGILTALLARGNLTQATTLRDELIALAPQHAELLTLSADLDRRLASAGRDSATSGAVALAGPGGA